MNILDVMERAAREAVPLAFALDVDNARDAVAELIKADKDYDEALRLANIGYGSTDEDRAAQHRLREAIARRRTALARVQGSAE